MDITRDNEQGPPADAEKTRDTRVTLPPGPPAGSEVGFELGDELGRGGMGIVYKARDRALDRVVAVKLLHEQFAPDSATARRFVGEARITGRLQHPGIPAVYQAGTWTDGRPFLALKLIHGRTLDQLLKAKQAVDVLGVFEAVCQAVAYAHRHGVIHRDLKPANVMVGEFGEVQVMDWGVAKRLADPHPLEHGSDPNETVDALPGSTPSEGVETQFGTVLGTPAFMAPEQARGALNRIDRRTDVFGLGAILCTMLTDAPPFVAATNEHRRRLSAEGHLDDALKRLDKCGAGPGLVDLCKRCLEFEPEDRPESAGRVAERVAVLRREYRDRIRQADLDRVSTQAWKTVRRRRRWIMAACFVLTALTVGAAVWYGKWRADMFDEANAGLKEAINDAVEKRVSRITDNEVNAKVNERVEKAIQETLQFDAKLRVRVNSDDGNTRLLNAVRRLGIAMNRTGRAEEMVDEYLSPQNTTLERAHHDKWYTAAQCYALCAATDDPPTPARVDKCLAQLRRCKEAGYFNDMNNVCRVRNDECFAALRTHQPFTEFVSGLKFVPEVLPPPRPTTEK